MIREDAKRLCLTILFFVTFALIHAQGWERTFGDANEQMGNGLIQLADGSYAIVGTTSSNNQSDIILLRTDPDGREEWRKTLGELTTNETAVNIQQDASGGYIIGGMVEENNTQRGLLIRTDARGNTLWQYNTETDSVVIRQAIALKDGGYGLVGYFFKGNSLIGVDQMNREVFLMKVNASGQLEWEQTYGGVNYDEGYAVVELADGSLYVGGITFENENYDVLVLKIAADGTQLWRKVLGTTQKEFAYDMVLSQDGSSLLFTGVKNFSTSTGDDIFVLKTDLACNNEGWIYLEKPGIQVGNSIEALPNNKVAVAGTTYLNNDTNPQLLITTVNAVEEEIYRNFGGDLSENAHAIVANQSNGFTIVGSTQSYGNGSNDIYLVQTNGLDISAANTIMGNISVTNGDCGPDFLSQGAPNQIVQVQGADTYYTVTDEFGNYTMNVPPGNYTVWPIALSPYWEVCQDTIQLDFFGVFDTLYAHYTIRPETLCPAMQTDIAVNHLRPGFSSIYTLTYCNNGTESADNALLNVSFDEYLHIDSTSVPELVSNGNDYIFYLGDVPVFECETIQVYVTLDSTVAIGQTHCVEAHLTPDALCFPVDPNWDEASIKIDAFCEYDTVKFKIRNEGNGDMEIPLNFIIIEDQIIGLTGEFQLDAQKDTTITVATNGATFRMEADQSPGHPGNSQPSVAVEGCSTEPFSVGHVIEFPQNDANPFIEIDCRENTSSFDPNDKQAFPRGYSEEHFIEPNTDIEYLIRFQNEGTDTAFQVVIRDTLSNWLSEYSIIPGASSHAYEFELYGQNILKFTFSDILLPPKDWDEAGSMGFVKFKIKQRIDNPIGTEILNSAAIYFDYNAPVITEAAYHLIGENFVEIDLPSAAAEQDAMVSAGIQVFPNPFETHTNFEISNPNYQEIIFQLFDLRGNLVQQDSFFTEKYIFERKNLAAGLYIFRMEKDGLMLGSGKIILK